MYAVWENEAGERVTQPVRKEIAEDLAWLMINTMEKE